MKNLNERHNREQEMMPPAHEDLAETRTRGPLMGPRQVDEFRGRWTAIQSSFVDEPRKAVEEADKLVASAIQQIKDELSTARANLEKQWSRGSETSTEDLRVCLRRYREFFDRLLTQV